MLIISTRSFTLGLFTENQFDLLVANAKKEILKVDKLPIAHLTIANSKFQWIISELNGDTGIGYGIIDLNEKNPRLGIINLDDILSLAFEENFLLNNYQFDPKFPLKSYFVMANEANEIIADHSGLENEFRAAADRYNM